MMVKSKTGVLETAISFGVVAVFLIAWFAVTSAGIVS